MNRFELKTALLISALLSIPFFGWFFWRALSTEPTLPTLTEGAGKAGEAMLADLRSLPSREIKGDKENFIVEEDGKDGIEISYAGQGSGNREQGIEENQPKTKLSLPKDYGKPLSIDLGEGKTVLITDLNGNEEYSASILADQPTSNDQQSTGNRRQSVILNKVKDLVGLDSSSSTQNDADSLGGSTSKYLAYTSPDERKTLLYAYQKDGASGEKKLKNWTLYNYGLGKETESYRIENAKIKIDDDGNADVFFFSQSDIQSEQAKADVDPNLMDRAQKFLQQETGNDIMNDTDRIPDFTIPKPTYFTKDGVEHEAEWNVILSESEGSRDSSASLGMTSSSVVLTVSLTENPDLYPIALDPTLAFTVPGSTTSGSVISGESSSYFGTSFASGDFNADGKMDLAVGASGYSSNTGRIYVFYQDGSYSVAAKDADVIITGEASNNYFGYALAVGDFNTDGKTDLATGGYRYSSDAGRVYIFYNDGSYPAAASGAEVTITEAAGSYYFGYALAAGDFNADGKTDLATGESGYNTTPVTEAGWVRIFYNDGTYPTAASSADVTITAQSSYSQFSDFLASGDFNADGKTDLAVGAPGFNSAGSNSGRSYIFYNDGSYPASADSADVFISAQTGEDQLGRVSSADLNADGKTDLIVTSTEYTSYSDTGRVYVFYSDGTNNYGTATCSGTPAACSAANADVFITGESSNGYFGASLSPGDFNSDGKIDLAVGAYGITTNTGRAYIFYNDGSYPTAAASADVIITGEAASNCFGSSLSSGDFNQDGKTDLAVGAYGYSSSAGRTYIFYSQNGQVNTNRNIAGEASSSFGISLTSGDFNADGKTDLAVGGYSYSTNTGRAYIFHNDGSIPTTAATADVIITGEATSNYFGVFLASGDFNADGKIDLVVGSHAYSSNTGRAYIFHNDGSIPTTAVTADVIITGEASSYFGITLAPGDFNADGKTDLAVGGYSYSTNTGRAYIFHNDGSIPTTAATADVIITGETTNNYFGVSIASGDFNADSKTDLAVGASGYSTNTGRTYIFHNDGSIPTTAATADVIITGETTSNAFGSFLSSGDFNSDGKTDLAVGAQSYSTSTGRAYIFHNDGSYPTAAASADVIITGEATSNYFSLFLVPGDFNADGRTDLAVGAYGYSTNTGKVYIFHNDGSIPTTAATADVIITGETTNNYFGIALTAGDFNQDGRTDLVVGAYGNSTSAGKVYFYETRENFAWNLQPVSSLRTSPNFSGEEMKITGEENSNFGSVMISGDFNADGRMDLAVSAYYHNSFSGRIYLFYNDGSLASGVTNADAIIAGETTMNYFGAALVSGDFNQDGRIDLAVGAMRYPSDWTGRVYIFHNDGTYPAAAASADVIITGESSGYFGASLAAGDFNADGKTDLAVGAREHSFSTGRVYLFHNDGTYPAAAASADVIITGEADSRFGNSIVSGDFNSDGKIDLVVGAASYSSWTGRAYIFYNDGSIPTAASSADIIITGESTSSFGISLASGDFNADGKTDLAVGAYGYSTNTGRAYIFYNDGSYPTAAASADVIITGEANSDFGSFLSSGDFNSDGKTDLVAGAQSYSAPTGRAYIFYNDGSYPTAAASADVIITGEAPGYFGASLVSGDFNVDGKIDLIVGAYGYGGGKGRVYLYTFNDGVITGEASSQLGYSMASGDFNADGRIDLAVGGNSYSTSTGRAYVFWNDGLAYPAASASADVIITGEASSYFGQSLASGDVNADGKTDLIVTAANITTNTGRAYIFYNGSIVTEAASSADVLITGEGTGNYFGSSSVTGDFNADGKTDLAVGAYGYSGYLGRAYVFYADGTNNFGAATCSGTPAACSAANADALISGEAVSSLGISITSGDWNADGKIDLAVGGYDYSSQTGRAYLFYNGSIVTEAASSADVLITGEGTSNFFAVSMASGDFNADGKTDLVVGSHYYSSYTGRAYVFYADGTNNFGTATCSGTPAACSAANADIIISGESTNSYFGFSFTSGDFNQDGRTDLAVGAYQYSSWTGRAYIFYNDGSISSSASSADIIMTGDASEKYGCAIVSADFNQDGKTDLATGALGYSSNTGRTYVVITEAAVESGNTVRARGASKFRGSVRMK